MMQGQIATCVEILKRKTNQSSARDQQTLADYLARVQTFRGMCSKEELNERLVDIAKYLEFEEIEEGNAIFHKGEDSVYFYIILAGCVSVFIPKATKDIDLEERWRKQLDRLTFENSEFTPSGGKNGTVGAAAAPAIGGLGNSPSRSSVANLINQGKRILKCLRCEEDEVLLKANNGLKYFRDDICTFKKIQKLGENDSFGESILSSAEQQRTATLIACDGIPLPAGSEIKKQNTKEEDNPQDDEQLDNKGEIIKKVVLLAKVSKWNFLKVFQYELDKRQFIRKALLSNYKKDLSDKVLDTLTFQFKEEHFEKGAHIVKQIESGVSFQDQITPSADQDKKKHKKDILRSTGFHAKGSSSESDDQGDDGDSPSANFKKRKQIKSGERKNKIRETLKLPGKHSNSETEYLYLLYKGSIEVRSKIITNSQKSQVKNIDSHILRQQVVVHANKIDVPIAHLTESEFFGHENWFKEDPNRIFNNIESYSPSDQGLKDRFLQMQNDFSIVVRETDTVVFKIPRQFLCEEQNRLLLYSLIQHGQLRHTRYIQICKEVAEKTDDSLQKQAKQQREFLTQEKNSKMSVSSGTTLIPIPVISQNEGAPTADLPLQGPSFSPKKSKREMQPTQETNLGNGEDKNNLENSPTFKIKLQNEFEIFRKRFDGTYNVTATQPIQPSPEYAEIQFQQLQLQQLKRQSTMSPAKSRGENSASPQKRSLADLSITNMKRSNDGSASPSKIQQDESMSPSRRQYSDESLSFTKLRSQSPSKKSCIFTVNDGSLSPNKRINHEGSQQQPQVKFKIENTTTRLSLGQIPEYFEGSEKIVDSSQNFPLISLGDIQDPEGEDYLKTIPLQKGASEAFSQHQKQLILRKNQRHKTMSNTDNLDIVKRNGPLIINKQESCLILDGTQNPSSPLKKPNQFQRTKTPYQQDSQGQDTLQSDNFQLPSGSAGSQDLFNETRKKTVSQVVKQQKIGETTASGLQAGFIKAVPVSFIWPEPSQINESQTNQQNEIILEKSQNEKNLGDQGIRIDVTNQCVPIHALSQEPGTLGTENLDKNASQQQQQSVISKLNQLSIKLTKSKLTPEQANNYDQSIPFLIKSILSTNQATSPKTIPNDKSNLSSKKNTLSSSSSQPTLLNPPNSFHISEPPSDTSPTKLANTLASFKNVATFSKQNFSTPIKNVQMIPIQNIYPPDTEFESNLENKPLPTLQAPQHFHGRSLINLNKVQPDNSQESTPVIMFPSAQTQKPLKYQKSSKSQHCPPDISSNIPFQSHPSNLQFQSQNLNSSQSQFLNPYNFTQPTLVSLSSQQTLSSNHLKSSGNVSDTSPALIQAQQLQNSQQKQLEFQDNKIKFLVTITNSSRSNRNEKYSPVKEITSQSITSRSNSMLKGSQLYSINEAKKEQLKNEFLRNKLGQFSDLPELQSSLDYLFQNKKRQINQKSSEATVFHEQIANQHPRISSIQIQSNSTNNNNHRFISQRNSEDAGIVPSQAIPSSTAPHSPTGSRINSFYYKSSSNASSAVKLKKVQKHYAALSSSSQPQESISFSSPFRQTQPAWLSQQKQTNSLLNNDNIIRNRTIINSHNGSLHLTQVPSQSNFINTDQIQKQQESQSKKVIYSPQKQFSGSKLSSQSTLSQIHQQIGKESESQQPPTLLLKAEKKGICPAREHSKNFGYETERGFLNYSPERDNLPKQQAITFREGQMTQQDTHTFQKARVVMNMKKLAFTKRATFDQSPNKALQAHIMQNKQQ